MIGRLLLLTVARSGPIIGKLSPGPPAKPKRPYLPHRCALVWPICFKHLFDSLTAWLGSGRDLPGFIWADRNRERVNGRAERIGKRNLYFGLGKSGRVKTL
jgi:hypothetical protein